MDEQRVTDSFALYITRFESGHVIMNVSGGMLDDISRESFERHYMPAGDIWHRVCDEGSSLLCSFSELGLLGLSRRIDALGGAKS